MNKDSGVFFLGGVVFSKGISKERIVGLGEISQYFLSVEIGQANPRYGQKKHHKSIGCLKMTLQKPKPKDLKRLGQLEGDFFGALGHVFPYRAALRAPALTKFPAWLQDICSLHFCLGLF